jgi:hypothetical protein
MKLFKSHIQHKDTIEYIYVIADDSRNALTKIFKQRFNGITGIIDLDKQKNDVRKNLQLVPEEVDWFWSEI